MSSPTHGAVPETTLGIDVGSVSVNLALIGGDGEILATSYRRCAGRPAAVLAEALEEVAAAHPEARPAAAVVTGSGKGRIAAALGLLGENEVVAHAAAVAQLYPHVRCVFEIGGQDSKFFELEPAAGGGGLVVGEHRLNELCAAGTGAFLDQQAERLGLRVEDLGELAGRARRPASIAGRCTVFAKSDMIHLQQIGRPLAEIVAGLCFAVARNYLGLLKGRRPSTPIAFQGGVAANRGVVQAFRTLLRLAPDQLLVPEHHRVMGAIGAAYLAREPWASARGELPFDLRAGAAKLRALPADVDSAAPPGRPPLQRPRRVSTPSPRPPRSCTPPLAGPTAVTLGIDSGSVGTKAVLLDQDGGVRASCYLRTGDDPLAAAQRALARLAAGAPAVEIRAAAATGSGRALVAEAIGADVVLNEISAQAEAAVFHDPQVDTVIEIGGQDSKFIQIRDGAVSRFEMNRVCSAGTGAFLEEQSRRLGVLPEIEFSEAAFRSRNPAPLGSRCTVFMDTDVVHHQQRGASRDDLLAGLAYSVVENYLEKVVGQLTLGDRVVFHGGVARNEAVVAAFEALLGRPVAVHPQALLTGAVGAALRGWRHHYRHGGATRFRGLGAPDLRVEVTTFECHRCANTCEINRLVLPAGEVFTGSVCGRFESSTAAGPTPGSGVPDLFAAREALLMAAADPPALSASKAPAPRGRVGLPRALAFHDLYPFYRRFLNGIGYEVVVSAPTDRATVELGAETVPVEVCLPVKCAFGHAAALRRQGVEPLFLASPRCVPDPGDASPRGTCPYLQACGAMVRATLGGEILDPAIPAAARHGSGRLPRSLPELGWLDHATAGEALAEAREAQRDFRRRCRRRGALATSAAAIRALPGPAVIVLGRPYTIHDPVACLDLPRRLRNLGLTPIPMDLLPVQQVELDVRWRGVEWGHARDLLKAATFIRSRDDLAAVLLTSFGCGADAFVIDYAREILGSRPHLVLEMDEHRAAAGLTTRLEAFADTLTRPREARPVKAAARRDLPLLRDLRDRTVYLHRSSDHLHAVAGALRAMGVAAEVLPPPDAETRRRGHALTGGGECHPFVMYAGDLARLRDRPGFRPELAAYYAPSYQGPCLLSQYHRRLAMIADELGLTGLEFCDVLGDGRFDPPGRGYHVLLGQGLYAIDRLIRYAVELQAWEVEPGAVQRAHRVNLAEVEAAVAKNDLLPALQRAVDRLRAIPRDSSRSPVPIGLVGDVYTRANPFSNNGLVERLIGLGCEVWMPWTIIDQGLYDVWSETRCERSGGYLTSLMNWAVGRYYLVVKRRIDQCFPADLRCPGASPGRHTFAAVQPMIDPDVDSVLTLNLGRVTELAEAGAAGILNVICHRCVLGTIGSALMQHTRRRFPGLPVTTLVLDGLQSTQQLTRLEAFVHQARQLQAHGRAAAAAATASIC